MQIHELTTSKNTPLDEGIVDAVKSGYNKLTGGISGAKQGVRLSRSNQQAQLLANKAFPIWKTFAAQLRASIKDPAKLQAFDNRTDGVYEKNLLAFVQKNLLGGAYLPNLTNKDEILALVKQLSAPTISNPVTTPAATTPAATTPAATTPAATTPAATIPTNQLTEALSPAQEKELFTQLVTQGTLAQNIAAGSSGQQQGGQQQGGQQQGGQQGNARSIYPQLIQVLENAGVKPDTLKNIGKIASQGFGTGSNQITSTGNPAVDALLLAMGFTGV